MQVETYRQVTFYSEKELAEKYGADFRETCTPGFSWIAGFETVLGKK